MDIVLGDHDEYRPGCTNPACTCNVNRGAVCFSAQTFGDEYCARCGYLASLHPDPTGLIDRDD